MTDDWTPIDPTKSSTGDVDDWMPLASSQTSPLRVVPSSPAYVGSRALGGLAEFAQTAKEGLSAGFVNPLSDPSTWSVGASRPSGQASVDQMLFGAPAAAPNAGTRYAGAAANAFTTNPVLSAALPGTTLASSLAAQGAHDLLPGSTVAPAIAGMLAGGMTQGLKNLLTSAPRSAADIADSIGSAKTLQEAGEALQQSAVIAKMKLGWQTRQNQVESLREAGVLEDDGLSIPSKFTRAPSVEPSDVKLLDKIVSANPEDAAAKLLSSAKRGGSDLQTLRDLGLGDAVDELASAHLRMGGEAAWAKLSPEGREALVPRAEHRAALDSASAKPAESAPPSAAEHQIRNMLLGEGFGGALGAFFGHGPEAGLLGAGAGHVLGIIAPSLARSGARAIGDPGRSLAGLATGAFGEQGEQPPDDDDARGARASR